MESKLVSEVIRLLETRSYNISFREISEKTGIPQGWIRRLQYGKIEEPSCPRIETLYEYLSKKNLDI